MPAGSVVSVLAVTPDAPATARPKLAASAADSHFFFMFPPLCWWFVVVVIST